MFQKSKDPITRTGLGIIGAVGVALIAVALWTTFVPLTDGEPDSDTVPSADDGPPVGPLPQVGDGESLESVVEETGGEDTELAEELAQDEAAQDATTVTDEAEVEAVEADQAEAAPDAVAVAEEETAAAGDPPPLEAGDDAQTPDIGQDAADTLAAEESAAAGDPPPLDVAGEAGAQEQAQADAGAQFTEEGMALLTADAEAGARVWNQCRACHVADEEQNRVGPHLVDIVGRQIASVEGFNYSNALQNVEAEHWTPEELDAWLADPRGYAPGTTMSYQGLRDAEDRANLLTWLYEMQQGE
ncbi:c-type cytochrome [Citreimonas salinaria]|uniref:Cytochrome c2 n=1 Tax=Citreimonas salinaria TaxID=321339 RepID=A0A1H3FB55_9RHOB|nr:c-type cytochrome [Citreimonas salinaria]SDX88077.1 Cytochrome c2 [Citreimonas salinaria]